MVRIGPVPVVRDLLAVTEHHPEHRRGPLHHPWHAALLQDPLDAVHQLAAVGLDPGQCPPVDRLQGGDGRGGGHGVARVGPAVGDHPRSDLAHDLFPAAHGGQGKAVGQGLGVADQVRPELEVLLGASLGDPETGLDLVQDQEDPVFVAEPAQVLQVPWFGHDRGGIAHDRLDDDAGDVPPVLPHLALHELLVVEGHHVHELTETVRDPGAMGHPQRGAPVTGPRHGGVTVPQGVIVKAVVVALELEDLVPPGKRPGDADRVHGRLGPRSSVTHQVDPCQFLDQLRRQDLVLRGHGEGVAYFQRFPHPGTDGRIGVAEHHRAEAQTIVDVAPVVLVPEVGPLGALENQGLVVAPVAKVRAHAQGHGPAGPFEHGPALAAALHGVPPSQYEDPLRLWVFVLYRPNTALTEG